MIEKETGTRGSGAAGASGRETFQTSHAPLQLPHERVNILLVDDRPDGLFAMEAVLSSPDYNLVSASSGEEALHFFLRDDFAVVLLDVQMPGMDGFETARHMRRAQGVNKTPIIFVTAINVEDRYVYAGYETGAVDYIFKPFDPTILRSKVGVFVDRYRMHAELLKQADLLREVERKDRERLVAELELESLRRYRNLADAVPDIVWKADATGSIDYTNKVWREYTGLSLEQSLGTSWQKAFEKADWDALVTAWEAARCSGTSFEAESRIRAANGAYRWHLVRALPETSAAGEIVAWVGTGTDIHDRKLAEVERADLLSLEQHARRQAELAVESRQQAEAVLVRAKEAAEEASRAKTQFLANMSHEIRTPLGVVLGFAELMLNKEQDESERREAVQAILRNGRQLSKLIDDFLDISKVEAGKLEVETLPFSLKAFLSDLVGEQEVKAKAKNLDLEMHLDTGLPDDIVSDPTRLRQILNNLIGNAIKFTDQGSVRLYVSVAGGEHPDGVVPLIFAIEDTGIGIEDAARERLFQEFMQADCSTTRRFGGTGLGLALSARLAQLLGGRVDLGSSNVGQGSCFVLALPMRLASPEERLALHQPQNPEAISKREIQAVNDGKGLRVLLVEDSCDNQRLVSYMLKLVGAQVTVAGDGAEGVRLALKDDYDILLMDIQMPKLDGFEATSHLRAAGYTKPIIALTAHAMREERDRCLAGGFDDHLGKPVNYRQLVAQLKRHAQRLVESARA